MEIACFLSRFPTFRIYGTGGHLGVDLTLTQLGTLTAMADNQTYTLSENVQVLLRGTGSTGYYSTTLSEINASDYTLTGWYDDFGYSAGGRIRIIVAVPNS